MHAVQDVWALLCSDGKALVSFKLGGMSKLAFEKDSVWRSCEGKDTRGRDTSGETVAVAQGRDDEGHAERVWGPPRGRE